jgi:UDP-N-acetylglucosamine--N-acetylmuramyl-(pentapeptide) pyrophosphoryl-undecaprenol N-acetylglucosamine transferase
MGKEKTILLAAGGTGGHVIPAYVLACGLQKKGYRCVFVGARGKFEEKWVPAHGFDIELLDIGGFTSGSLHQRFKAMLQIPKALWVSFCLLRKYKPDRLFGIGGYASGPIMLLATLMKIPTAILEPNSVPGFSNKVLGKFVNRVYVVFDHAAQWFAANKVKNFGHLLRPEIHACQAAPLKQEPLTIAVLGGSQGAMHLNHAICTLLETHPKWQTQARWFHQTGARDYQAIEARYQAMPQANATVAPFFEDMVSVYAQSHMVIGRSGSSILEFAAAGLPSILIPLPSAADQHQLKNAQSLVAIGGAQLIEQKELTPERLDHALTEMTWEFQEKMRQALRVLDKPHALSDILEDFLSLR